MRILILDDQYERDPSTQELFRWRLRKQVDATTYAGILLDFCADSSDALRPYREYGPFDLIITAFGQRGMGWNAFIQAMRKENPNQAILLYTAVADARNLPFAGGGIQEMAGHPGLQNRFQRRSAMASNPESNRQFTKVFGRNACLGVSVSTLLNRSFAPPGTLLRLRLGTMFAL